MNGGSTGCVFPRLDDSGAATRGGRIYLVPRKAGPVVPADAAPGEILRIDEVSEGKPVPRITIRAITWLKKV